MQSNYYNSISKQNNNILDKNVNHYSNITNNNQIPAFMTLNSLRETSDINDQNYSTIDTILLPDYERFTNYPHRPLTKVI